MHMSQILLADNVFGAHNFPHWHDGGTCHPSHSPEDPKTLAWRQNASHPNHARKFNITFDVTTKRKGY